MGVRNGSYARGELCGRRPPVVDTQAGGDLFSPVDGGVAVSKGRLEVTGNEAVENSMGDKEGQPESHDGDGSNGRSAKR